MKQTVRLALTLSGVLLAGLFAGPLSLAHAQTGALFAYQDKSVVALGKTLYRQNCAACHGVNLEGQEGWQDKLKDGKRLAPPHDATGHTWHHPDPQLFAITKYGIESLLTRPYPNDMPLYEEILDDTGIKAVLAYIKSSWPKEIQDRHNLINERYAKTRK
jgi:mono/diheme cytochrome c family protein